MLPYFHQSQSKKLLQKHGFSKIATSIVSETSKWPDWFRWNEYAPHAQSPSLPTGQPIDIEENKNASSSLLREYLDLIRRSDANERLVWLGFALHLVQDLAVHQGRTNDEHAWQILLGLPNPDLNIRGLRQGKVYGARLLEHIERTFSTNEYEKLRTSAGARLLSESEQVALLGPRDFSWGSIPGFIQIGLRYPFLRSEWKHIRWYTEQVLRDGLK